MPRDKTTKRKTRRDLSGKAFLRSLKRFYTNKFLESESTSENKLEKIPKGSDVEA